MLNSNIPEHARVVVIGGGIIGCSVAYHLAKLGWKEIILLERDQITSGTTWHAAGLMVTFGSTSETSTSLRKYTKNLYKNLEAETGQSTGFKPVGFIEVASNKDRLEEFRRVSNFNRYCGIDVHEISPSEIEKLFPLARTDDLLAGFYVPDDGRVNPVDACMALAKGARLHGVNIYENTPVTKILTKNKKVPGVETGKGKIYSEYVVNCTGMWARQLGEEIGVCIPNQAAEHYYLITEELKDMPPNMPVLEDPSCYGYYRDEVGGLMIGLFEPKCAPWKLNQIPKDFSFGEIPPDFERMMPYLEKAMSRVPKSLELGIKKFFCGPESFTPDLRPIVGEAPELKNYFVAAGLNSIGILTGGGIGKLLAEWIIQGYSEYDITGINIDRFHPYQMNLEYRKSRTIESLGLVYQCHYPYKSYETARGAKQSPFHHQLLEQGAYFKDVSGWESPDWYAPTKEQAKINKHSWKDHEFFSFWKEEHLAARENVILMDMSFTSKFAVKGKNAGEFLEYVCSNSVSSKKGMITYTQMLNEQGKIEADITVMKLDEDDFLVVATDTAHRHVENWLKKHSEKFDYIFIMDITQSFGQLNIQGPNSRGLLQEITTADLSNENFPFRTVKEIDIGFAKVLCTRITYVGELGFELCIPTAFCAHVYSKIVEAGKKYQLKHAGLKALASLRMEKAYKDYGHDLDNTDDPLTTGLGFAVDFKKSDFLGKSALQKLKDEGNFKKQMVQVLVKDPCAMLYHAEVLWRNSKPIGYIRSASYGFSIGGAVGLAMIEVDEPITKEYLESGSYEIEIAETKYEAKISLRPMYDPKMERIKI